MFKHASILLFLTVSIFFCFSDATAEAQIKDEIVKAKQTYDSGDKEEAVKLFTLIIGSGKLNKRDLADCYYDRAFALFGTGNSNRAIMDLRRVIQIEPDNKEALIKIIQFIDYGTQMSMFLTKDKWSSLSGLKSSMANSAANWLRSEGLMGWMILHIKEVNEIVNTTKYDSSLEKSKIESDMQKKYSVAVENFSEIISKDETPPLKRVVNLFDRSIAYERLSKYNEAISDMEQVMLIAPKDASGIGRLSALLEKKGLKKNEIKSKLADLEREPIDGYLFLAEKKPVVLTDLNPLPLFGLYIGQDLDEAKKVALNLLKEHGFKTNLTTLTDKTHAQGHIYVEDCNPLNIHANRKRKVKYITFGKELVDKIFNTSVINGEAFAKKVISELNFNGFKKEKGLFGSIEWVYEREDGMRITVSESIKTINLQRVNLQ